MDSAEAGSQTTYGIAHSEVLATAISSWHIYLFLLPKTSGLKQN